MKCAREKLIIALDDLSKNEALALVKSTKNYAQTFKIGLSLFSLYGPSLVEEIRALDVDVFLDLKFHDISMQVHKAVTHACKLQPRFITVHALGGFDMLASAQEAAKNAATKLLAVTVLTSATKEQWQSFSKDSIPESVEKLSKLAVDAGIFGLVASPHEVTLLKKLYGQKAFVVCPGVRLRGHEAHDQARIMTPAEAITAGADALVVGRPISKAKDCAHMASLICEEIDRALKPEGELYAHSC